MAHLTVEVPAELQLRLLQRAQVEQVTPDDVVVAVLEAYLTPAPPPEPEPDPWRAFEQGWDPYEG